MTPLRRWLFCTVIACSATLACGGGSSRSTPTAPPAPAAPAPTTPSNTWTIAGTVVDTVTRAPIGGARIAPSWDLAAVTSGDGGAYQLGAVANPPTTPYDVTVSADGFVTRKQWVGWQAGPRADITFDLIRDSAPFSMDFYRQLVRGTFDQEGAPWRVLRLPSAPKFYVKTIDQNGRPVEPEVLEVVLEALGRAVPAFTGGTMSAAAIETGTETRAEMAGWINVLIRRDPNERSTCGTAYIGREAGEITLMNDVCSCGSRKIPGALVLHEVGHALGFFHVSDRDSIMYPFIPGNCPAGDPSAAERYHSGIAYSRPRGNTEPDNDPSSGHLLSPGDALGPSILVKN